MIVGRLVAGFAMGALTSVGLLSYYLLITARDTVSSGDLAFSCEGNDDCFNEICQQLGLLYIQLVSMNEERRVDCLGSATDVNFSIRQRNGEFHLLSRLSPQSCWRCESILTAETTADLVEECSSSRNHLVS